MDFWSNGNRYITQADPLYVTAKRHDSPHNSLNSQHTHNMHNTQHTHNSLVHFYRPNPPRAIDQLQPQPQPPPPSQSQPPSCGPLYNNIGNNYASFVSNRKSPWVVRHTPYQEKLVPIPTPLTPVQRQNACLRGQTEPLEGLSTLATVASLREKTVKEPNMHKKNVRILSGFESLPVGYSAKNIQYCPYPSYDYEYNNNQNQCKIGSTMGPTVRPPPPQSQDDLKEVTPPMSPLLLLVLAADQARMREKTTPHPNHATDHYCYNSTQKNNTNVTNVMFSADQPVVSNNQYGMRDMDRDRDDNINREGDYMGDMGEEVRDGTGLSSCQDNADRRLRKENSVGLVAAMAASRSQRLQITKEEDYELDEETGKRKKVVKDAAYWRKRRALLKEEQEKEEHRKKELERLAHVIMHTRAPLNDNVKQLLMLLQRPRIIKEDDYDIDEKTGKRKKVVKDAAYWRKRRAHLKEAQELEEHRKKEVDRFAQIITHSNSALDENIKELLGLLGFVSNGCTGNDAICTCRILISGS